MQRNEIIRKCDEILSVINGINTDTNKHLLVKKAAESLMKRVDKIKEICNVEKYNICFIGKAGIGKSTAISHLLGLVDEEELKEQGEIDKIPLLKTASGKTTLCATEIRMFDRVGVEIEIKPLEEEEFNNIVEEFCRSILQDSKTEEKINCPSEVKRAISNMAGLKCSKNWDENKEEYEVYIKEALGKEMNEEDKLQDLLEAVLKKIDYKNRKNIILKSEGETLKRWLKETLVAINDGKSSDVPYPDKIIIKLNRKEFGLPLYMNGVFDTRGLDGEVAREDISQIIDDINNFCIICDEIATYGNRLASSPLKEKYPIQERDLKYRTIVMGLERGYELEAVNDASGRESGKDIKKDEAIDKWNSEKVGLDKINMLFYNPLFGLKNDGKLVIEKNGDYEEERENILNNLENFIKNMYIAYNEELQNISASINSLKNNKLEEIHMQLFKEMIVEVDNRKAQVNSNYDLLFSELRSKIVSIHPSTLNASVRRRGSYDGSFNVYDEAGIISIKEYDSALDRIYYYILQRSNSIFSKNADDDLSKALLEGIMQKIGELYMYYRKQNEEVYKGILQDNIKNDAIWEELKGYWGSGRGNYRGSIADSLENRIRAKKVVEKIASEKNTLKFIEKLGEFLEI